MSFRNDHSAIDVDGTRIEWLDPTYNTFRDRTTVLYGTSNCGKSFMTAHIMMNILNKHIPTAFLICPSEVPEYEGRIFNCCRFKKLDKTFIEWLERLWERQEIPSEIYKRANSLETLDSIYKIVRTNAIDEKIALVKSSQDKNIRRVENMDVSVDIKNKKIEDILHDHKNLLTDLYKAVIKRNIHTIQKYPLNENQKYTIHYIDFNPRVLLIFDDHIADLNKFIEKKEIFKNLFYRGRHRLITQIHLIQDDKEIKPALRKNAHISIFCSIPVANTFFNTASNGIDKTTKNKSGRIIDEVFKEKHRKLVFMKDSAAPFRYFKAEPAGSGYFGSPHFINLCSRADKKTDTLNKENGFYHLFNISNCTGSATDTSSSHGSQREELFPTPPE